MRIAQPSNLLIYLPLYIAIEGSDQQILSFGTAKAAIEAVVKGQADIAIGDPFLFDYFDYSANNIQIVAGFVRKICHAVITFNPFMTEAAKKMLTGKVVVSYPEPSTSFFIARNLKDQFALSGILETSFNTELGPLLTQEADLAVVIEPNLTYALANGAKIIIDLTKSPAVLTGLFTTKEILKNQKKEINELLQLLQKGIQLFEKDQELSFRIAKKYFPIIEDSILVAAIKNIKTAQTFCQNLQFTDEEITAGLELRRIKMSTRAVKQQFFSKI